jgi:hypothetical protein
VQSPVLRLLVEDLHDEILLGVLAEVLDAQLTGDHVQVGEQLGLEFGYSHCLALRLVFMFLNPLFVHYDRSSLSCPIDSPLGDAEMYGLLVGAATVSRLDRPYLATSGAQHHAMGAHSEWSDVHTS